VRVRSMSERTMVGRTGRPDDYCQCGGFPGIAGRGVCHRAGPVLQSRGLGGST
jgi:hypothetical protein